MNRKSRRRICRSNLRLLPRKTLHWRASFFKKIPYSHRRPTKTPGPFGSTFSVTKRWKLVVLRRRRYLSSVRINRRIIRPWWQWFRSFRVATWGSRRRQIIIRRHWWQCGGTINGNKSWRTSWWCLQRSSYFQILQRDRNCVTRARLGFARGCGE